MLFNQMADDGSMTKVDQDICVPVLNFTNENKSIIDRYSTSSTDLLCICGQSIFVKNFLVSRFISIGFRCRICKEVLVTPCLPDGDIVPTGSTTVAFPDRDLNFSEDLITPAAVIFIGEKTLENQQRIYQDVIDLRKGNPITFEEVIKDVCERYSRFTLGHDQTQIKAARNHLKHSEIPFGKYPLAWSLEYIKSLDSLSLDAVNSDANMLAAIRFITNFYQTTSRWGHHPRFSNYAKVFSHINGFHHNIAQLDAATMLLEQGHILNLAKEVGNSVRTADMYFNFIDIGKFFLEAKAPEMLQWANTGQLDSQHLRRKIIDTMKSCQIKRSNRGILAIGCSRQKDTQIIHDCVAEAVRLAGREVPGMAAVIVMQQKPITITQKSGTNISPGELVSEVSIILNQSYDGRNPVMFSSNPQPK